MGHQPSHDRRHAAPVPTAAEAGSALPLGRILQDWRGAFARVGAYLAAVGVPPAGVGRLAERALERALGREPGASAIRDAMDETERLLAETRPLENGKPADDDRRAFTEWRLAAWLAGAVEGPDGRPLERRAFAPTPPIARGHMVPATYRGRRLGEWRRRSVASADDDREDLVHRERRAARKPWSRRGQLRRLLLLVLVIAPSVAAGEQFLAMLPATVWYPAELTMSIAFGALFGWISVGFWTAVFGFFVLLRGGDRFSITRTAGAATAPLDPAVRTAVVMPVRDEPVERVFAGLRAVRASLERIGAHDFFDFFVLSDSVDPDVWVDEEEAWARWLRDADGAAAREADDRPRHRGGIFYRRRRVHLKRKSGNVADFCRRFGRRYRYMVVLDADSVMSGDCLARLVGMMEANPHVGIIQTAPRVVRSASLFARIQQFASRLYGPMFAAGMHYWQLGDSPYWGHNAIIRVEPFMQYCGLPRLSGSPPFGGDIMSHDFVEAALLGRAGWSIWLAFDLPGSYEETPGSLLAEMQRDRRWCQGNLQHLRLIFTEGIVRAHRALFLNGIFSYVSAVLWLAFLVASTAEAVLWSLWGPDYFPAGPSLFPTWPVWRPERAHALFVAVLTVLLVPKLLALVLAIGQRRAAGFGGALALLNSVLLETLATALLAPVRMLFYCRFVLMNLIGRTVTWRGGEDEHEETGWGTALRRHGPDTLVACAWGYAIRALHPEVFWWVVPVAGALVLSVPLSVLASRARLGAAARAVGLFVTPEETTPPAEVRELEADLVEARVLPAARAPGFARAVVDPGTNALHTALLRSPRSLLPRVREARSALAARALDGGPEALSRDEKRIVLSDWQCMAGLHTEAWRLESPDTAARWGLSASRPAI